MDMACSSVFLDSSKLVAVMNFYLRGHHKLKKRDVLGVVVHLCAINIVYPSLANFSTLFQDFSYLRQHVEISLVGQTLPEGAVCFDEKEMFQIFVFVMMSQAQLKVQL